MGPRTARRAVPSGDVSESPADLRGALVCQSAPADAILLPGSACGSRRRRPGCPRVTFHPDSCSRAPRGSRTGHRPTRSGRPSCRARSPAPRSGSRAPPGRGPGRRGLRGVALGRRAFGGRTLGRGLRGRQLPAPPRCDRTSTTAACTGPRGPAPIGELEDPLGGEEFERPRVRRRMPRGPRHPTCRSAAAITASASFSACRPRPGRPEP